MTEKRNGLAVKRADPEDKKADSRLESKSGAKKKGSSRKANPKVVLTAVAVLLAAAVIAGSVLAVTKNLFGGRDKLLAALSSMDPSFQSAESLKAELDRLEQDLSEREKKIASKETSLAKREQELESSLQEETRGGSLESYLADLSDERIAQIKQVGTIYSGMDSVQAASALSQLESVRDMAAVVYYMKAADAATVLGCMDAQLAAQITENMLG